MAVYLYQGSYVMLAICLSVSIFAQKLTIE